MWTEKTLAIALICGTIVILCVIGTISNHLKDRKGGDHGEDN